MNHKPKLSRGKGLRMRLAAAAVAALAVLGTVVVAAYAQGIHTALLVSAPITSLSIIAAFFVKKAKKSAGAPAGH